MIRKMQTKAQTLDEPTMALLKLAMSGAMMALVFVAATVLLYISPAHANSRSLPQEPLAVWTESLPDQFQIQAAKAGLDIVEIDIMTAMPMPFYLVTIQSADGLAPAIALQVLNSIFPATGFERIDEAQSELALIEY